MSATHSPSHSKNASPKSNTDPVTASASLTDAGNGTGRHEAIPTAPISQPKVSAPPRATEESGEEERRGKRMKYVPKACAQCRRRKLRCSDERPCERCVRSRVAHCSLLDDDPTDDAPRSTASNGLHSILPRLQSREDRDVVSLLLDRLERMENTTEELRRTVLAASSSLTGDRYPPAPQHQRELGDDQVYGSHGGHGRNSHEQPVQAWSRPGPSTLPSPEPDAYAADTALMPTVRHLPAMLATELDTAGVTVTDANPVVEQASPGLNGQPDPGFSTEPMPAAAGPWGSRLLAAPPAPCLSLCCGPVRCYLPTTSQHDDYLEFFFAQVNQYHPCLNVNDVRRRSSIVYDRAFGGDGEAAVSFRLAPYLSLMMSIYACVDVFRGSPGSDGYFWYRQAQELVGRRQVTATGHDMTGIQILLLQALFLTYRGSLDSGYAAVGRATRLCFQHGLNNAARWSTKTPYQRHMRQRVLFTTFCLDQRISLMCGRPPGMRIEDIAVSPPIGLQDEDAYLDAPLPRPSHTSTIQPYMDSYTAYARFCWTGWSTIASPTIEPPAAVAATEALDVELAEWLAEFAMVGEMGEDTTHEQKQQRFITRLLMLDLRLLLRRKDIITSEYDIRVGDLCGTLACDIASEIHRASYTASWRTSYYLKTLAPTMLLSPIVVLATLLIRTPHPPSTNGLLSGSPSSTMSTDHCRLRFRQAVEVVTRLAPDLPVAAHVASQVEQVVRVTEATLAARDARGSSVVESQDSQVELTSITDLNSLFSHEIDSLTNNGGFPEAGTADGDFWSTVFSQPPQREDMQWDTLFASFEDIFP